MDNPSQLDLCVAGTESLCGKMWRSKRVDIEYVNSTNERGVIGAKEVSTASGGEQVNVCTEQLQVQEEIFGTVIDDDISDELGMEFDMECSSSSVLDTDLATYHITEEELEAERLRDANELLEDAVMELGNLEISQLQNCSGIVRSDYDNVRRAIALGATVSDELVVRSVMRNDYQMVRLLLQGGGNPNAVSHMEVSCVGGCTILGYAVRYCYIDIVIALIHAGANVNGRGVDWMTPLMWATHGNRLSCVQVLLRAGADVNVRDNVGRTALLIGSGNGGCAMIRVLLDAGADVNAQDASGNTPLMDASRSGVRPWLVTEPRSEVAWMLLEAGADPNMFDCEKHTALQLATLTFLPEMWNDDCYEDVGKLVKLLLDAGANVNAVGYRGTTPLMNACKGMLRKGEHIIQMLLDGGADVNAENEEGMTALMLAVQYNTPLVVQVLLEKEADVNMQNKCGASALLLGAADSSAETIDMLIRAGSSANVQDFRGTTPLIAAFGYGRRQWGNTATRRKIGSLLLAAGADVNLVDRHGNTALIVAASHDASGMPWRLHVNELQQHMCDLIKAGASVNAVGADGATALSNVCKSQVEKGESVVNLLLDEGANVNSVDHNGMTPLMHAADYNDEVVIGTLLNRGADVHKQNYDGAAVAEFIILNLAPKTAIILMRAGADISRLDTTCSVELQQAKEEWAANRLNLQHLCREVIRMYLMAKNPGVHVKYLVEALRLPYRLATYVADIGRFDVSQDLDAIDVSEDVNAIER